MSLRQREVARRLYAKELNESTLVYKEHEDTYAPQYLLSSVHLQKRKTLALILTTGALDWPIRQAFFPYTPDSTNNRQSPS
jgi:hypothetical protein